MLLGNLSAPIEKYCIFNDLRELMEGLSLFDWSSACFQELFPKKDADPLPTISPELMLAYQQ